MTAKQLMIDPVSHLVACPVELKWQEVEATLNRSDYTLGFLNPKCSGASLRELIKYNGPNLFYRQYGHPIDWCIQVRSRGRNALYETKRVPRTAAGPDFNRLLLFSGRRYATLEEVTIRFHPMPERIDWHWSYWPSMEEAMSFIDGLEASDVPISFAGSYDTDQQPRALLQQSSVLVTLRFAGLSSVVAAGVERAGAYMRRRGGETLRISRRKVIPFFEKLMEGTY